MTSGDLVSLFQLGTALNLGFGALVSFGEPLKQRMRREITNDEAVFEELIIQRNEAAADVESIFEISRLYLELRRAYRDATKQWEFLDWYVFHIIIILLAIVSFLGLSICSAYSKDDINPIWLFIALLCNGGPVAIAITHLFLSMQLRSDVYPRLLAFQIALRSLSISMSDFSRLKLASPSNH